MTTFAPCGAVRRVQESRRARTRVGSAEQRRFRTAFARFWDGDDDCWRPGRTDALADAALAPLAAADLDGAVRAVVRRGEATMNMDVTPGAQQRLRDFLVAYVRTARSDRGH